MDKTPLASIEAVVSYFSIRGLLLLCIYTNDPSDDLSTTAKFFTNDASLFP